MVTLAINMLRQFSRLKRTFDRGMEIPLKTCISF